MTSSSALPCGKTSTGWIGRSSSLNVDLTGKDLGGRLGAVVEQRCVLYEYTCRSASYRVYPSCCHDMESFGWGFMCDLQMHTNCYKLLQLHHKDFKLTLGGAIVIWLHISPLRLSWLNTR